MQARLRYIRQISAGAVGIASARVKALNGRRPKGRAGSFPAGAETYRRQVVTAAIVPFIAGQRPTEPGWYVRQDADGDRDVVQITHTTNDGMDVSSVGDEMWASLADELRRGCTFIARIYPDRIEGREG